MAESQDVYAFDLDVALAAADRWEGREQQHEKFERAVRKKRYSDLDTKERCAARANRLLGKLADAAPEAARAIARGFEGSTSREISRGVVTTETISDDLLERIIGKSRDFLFVEFLEQAVHACKSVGRIVTKLGPGRVGYGTGFMVSPRLLLTNHHVLDSAATALKSMVEFGFQRDRRGKELARRSFKLDPGVFFLNDKGLDFALVAVATGADLSLKEYGWCPLIGEPGKIVAGEPINIIQHPKGEIKQVVVRENRLVDPFEGAELFYHYQADTEPGSSGSPVFNDQWEVVALHHSGVPQRNKKGELMDRDGGVWRKGDDPTRLAWVANEGVRVSKLLAFMVKAKVRSAEKPLLEELLAAEPPAVENNPVPVPPDSRPTDHVTSTTTESPSMAGPTKQHGQSVTLTVPLHITFSIGAAETVSIGVGPTTAGTAPDAPDEGLLEKIEPDPSDPDYESRPGYDRDFLGFEVPMPRLTNATRSKAYALPGESGDGRFELKYHHFSVLFNKARQLAFAAAVNYDPTAKVQHPRDKAGDKWFYDPRVVPEMDLQAGEDLYAGNALDRGHLVRRADAAWGRNKKEAKLANDDTFHFTNCSPQHAITNQGIIKQAPPGLKLWGSLEEHVAAQGKKGKRKLCIFNGPVFRTSDKAYRGVKMPREFWKVVVFANDDGEPGAAAFVLTQAGLIEDLQEEFEVGEYKAVQVRVKDLEAKTGLNLGPFQEWDVMEKEGAEEHFTGDAAAVVLDSVADVVL